MSDKTKLIIGGFFILFFPLDFSFAGNCDYSWQRDSRGRRCGGRAANVIPGGRFGGDGRYIDPQGRERQYGRDNDPYDRDRKRKPLIPRR